MSTRAAAPCPVCGASSSVTHHCGKRIVYRCSCGLQFVVELFRNRAVKLEFEVTTFDPPARWKPGRRH